MSGMCVYLYPCVFPLHVVRIVACVYVHMQVYVLCMSHMCDVYTHVHACAHVYACVLMCMTARVTRLVCELGQSDFHDSRALSSSLAGPFPVSLGEA